MENYFHCVVCAWMWERGYVWFLAVYFYCYAMRTEGTTATVVLIESIKKNIHIVFRFPPFFSLRYRYTYISHYLLFIEWLFLETTIHFNFDDDLCYNFPDCSKLAHIIYSSAFNLSRGRRHTFSACQSIFRFWILVNRMIDAGAAVARFRPSFPQRFVFSFCVSELS